MSPVKSRVIYILMISIIPLVKTEDCMPRDFGQGSVVCVCNATYCDSTAVNVPKLGQYCIYESGKSGNRMSEKIRNFNDSANEETDSNEITIALRPDVKYQIIYGFGGAFTDATGINMKNLSEQLQDRIIDSYFGVNGSRYNLGRVPIGGTDFSERVYTLDDSEGDDDLNDFQLANEDLIYKIPLMQKALSMSPNLRFVSAAWSAPAWMKTNDNATGYGFLRPDYYQTYANYLMKFLVEYKKRGLKIWAISTGNEPADAVSPLVPFNTMGWTPMTMATWVAENLGPTIANSMSKETMIFVLDDQRYFLPSYIIDVFSNLKAKQYTAGIAVHWYGDRWVVPQVIEVTHNMYPDKFLILTEGCAGSFPEDQPKVSLGDWSRAEQYMHGIMENLSHWMTGYIDWNLVLDKQGGPNWAKNYVDAPIITNPETDEFFKQPIFYAIAHFSKFIPVGSRRIDINKNSEIPSIAFITPDDSIVIVLYNKDDEDKMVKVDDPERGNITTNIPSHSIQTIIYRV